MKKLTWENLKKETAKRNLEILKEYEKGQGTVTMDEIGKKYKLTRSRVSKIIEAMKEKVSSVVTIDKG